MLLSNQTCTKETDPVNNTISDSFLPITYGMVLFKLILNGCDAIKKKDDAKNDLCLG